MMQAITNVLSNPMVVGTTLVLIGLHQFTGRLGFLNTDFATLPILGWKVTVAVGAGLIMVMNKRDSISPDEFVGMMADTIEGAKAHGHL
jgi:riboflavin transporter FmnP